MPRADEPEDQAADKKNDSEAAERAEDAMERERGGPDEKAVDNAREQLSRLRDRD